MGKKRSGRRLRLKPVDAFDLIRLLARSQHDPRKAVCELVEFQGVDHSFFNFNVDSDLFELTMKNTDRFLEENGEVVRIDGGIQMPPK